MLRDYRLDPGPKLDGGGRLDSKLGNTVKGEFPRLDTPISPKLSDPQQPSPKQPEPKLSEPRPDLLKVDLFQSTLNELHHEAPAELLRSLRERLEGIRNTIPNCAKTAEACLLGLASDKTTLLHVLTAAYLINGGVMLKHQAQEEAGDDYQDFNFQELEKELAQLQP
jgi:hypothetical protein